MSGHLALRFELQHKQVATPRLQQAVRLLQLSAVDFAQEITALIGRNPFLELADIEGDGDVGGGGGVDAASAASAIDDRRRPVRHDAFDIGDAGASSDAGDAGDPDAAHGVHGANGLNAAGADLSAEVGADFSIDASDPSYPGFDADDVVRLPSQSVDSNRHSADRASAADRLPAAPGLRPLLTQQAGWLRLSPRDHALLCALIESLDDDGYLRMDLAELALMTGLEPPADGSEMRAALHRLQALEPAGVGARTLVECLLLQLGQSNGWVGRAATTAAGTAGIDTLARRILTQHLDRLAQHDLAGLAQALGCGAPEVACAWRRIRQLDPRPGARYTGVAAAFVTPDVTVRKTRGVWSVHLNPASAPRLRVNRLYAELFQRHREASHGELADHLKEAHWMVRNVAQRLSTIAAVAEAILRRQHRFLELGPLAMRPLGLREIAAEVGVHESTVSRVTNNKFMATPVGTFELKYFFSRALPTRAGGACSATAIRGVIAQLIAAESVACPLSDGAIARLLARQGLSVARRTVTHYRQRLKLPAAGRRHVLVAERG